MNDERAEQESPKQPEAPAQCGPACNCGSTCGSTGLGTKGKMIICLVVAIAAGAVLARGLALKAEPKAAQGQPAFDTTLSACSPGAPPVAIGKVEFVDIRPSGPSLPGEPLKDLSSLNQVATQKDAVFLYLPEKGQAVDDAVMRQMEQAAAKAQAAGTTMACYTLDTGSYDYARVTSQTPAPCVLAFVKGRGMSAVTGDFSEGKLLQAIVAASRPSACGPSGCSPSSPGCKN